MFFSIRVKTLMFFCGGVFHWRQTPENAREIPRKSKETQEKGRGKLKETERGTEETHQKAQRRMKENPEGGGP